MTGPHLTGPAGPTGPAGSPPNGGLLLNGSGAPADIIGANGDFYYDPLAKLLYGPKSGGAWPGSPTSIGGSSNSVIDWDLTPSAVLPSLSVSQLPVPYNTIVYNPASVLGDSYSSNFVTLPPGFSIEYGMVTLAAISPGQSFSFYWKPQTGTQNLQFFDSSFMSVITIIPPDLAGTGISAYSQTFTVIDPDFVLGDTLLVQVAANGDVSFKTTKIPTTIPFGNVSFVASDITVLMPMDQLTNSSVTGQLSAADLGSGLTIDPGISSLSTLRTTIPNTARNLDALRVTVAGTYNGVTYQINEGAIVLDAVNGIVGPLTSNVGVQPSYYETFFANVGPTDTFTSLATLSRDLIFKGIFARGLYVVYNSSTIADSSDIFFYGHDQVSIQLGVGITQVTVPGTSILQFTTAGRSITLSGSWYAHQFVGRNVFFNSATLYSESSVDVVNFDGVDSTITANLDISLTNLGYLSIGGAAFSNTFKFQGYSNLNLIGNTHADKIYVYDGAGVILKQGTHTIGEVQFYDNADNVSNFTPSSLVSISGMGQAYISKIQSNSIQTISEALHIGNGSAKIGQYIGDFTQNTNIPSGKVTTDGIIYDTVSASGLLLHGSGAPIDSLGSNGDFYIDQVGSYIYGPKASGTWPAGVSLVGPKGDPGASGVLVGADFPPGTETPAVLFKFDSGGMWTDLVVRQNYPIWHGYVSSLMLMADTADKVVANTWADPYGYIHDGALRPDGTSQQGITCTPGSLSKFDLSSSDFTIEFFFTPSAYDNTYSYHCGILSFGDGSLGSTRYFLRYIGGAGFQFYVYPSPGSPQLAAYAASVLTTGAEHHIAVQRISGVYSITVNGADVTYEQHNVAPLSPVSIYENFSLGQIFLGGYSEQMTGSIRQFRMTKGVAVYPTYPFTPPTNFPATI